jgi:hypothetical protein
MEVPTDRLLAQRYDKFRKMGVFHDATASEPKSEVHSDAEAERNGPPERES